MQCYLATLHACTYSLALGMGTISCTEWVGGGVGRFNPYPGENAIFPVVLPLPLFPGSWLQKGGVYNGKWIGRYVHWLFLVSCTAKYGDS